MKFTWKLLLIAHVTCIASVRSL